MRYETLCDILCKKSINFVGDINDAHRPETVYCLQSDVNEFLSSNNWRWDYKILEKFRNAEDRHSDFYDQFVEEGDGEFIDENGNCCTVLQDYIDCANQNKISLPWFVFLNDGKGNMSGPFRLNDLSDYVEGDQINSPDVFVFLENDVEFPVHILND